MHKLIWAELKKILQNNKVLIGISVTVLTCILLFSFVFLNTKPIEYYDGVHSDNYNYEGLSGADVAQEVQNYIDLLKEETQNDIDDIARIVNSQPKTALKQLYDGLLDYNQQFRNIIIPIDTDVTLTAGNIDEFIDEEGEFYSVMQQIDTMQKDIENSIIALDNLENLIFFKNETGPDSHFLLKSEISYNWRENFYIFTACFNTIKWDNTQDKTYLANLTNNLLNDIQSLQNNINSIYLFDNGLITAYKAKIDMAIELQITQNIIDNAEDFVQEYVLARFDEYKEDIQPYYDKAILDKVDADNISAIYQKAEKMRTMLNTYIQKYINYNALTNFSDTDLSQYNIPFQSKYNMKSYITMTEYIVKNNLHVENSYPYNNNAPLPQGYTPAGGPLSFAGFINVNLFSGDINIYSYLNFMFSIMSVVIITICIVLSGGSIAGEQSQGTIKMLMIRPYKRWKILTAKLLSTLIVSLALILISLIILIIIGLILGLNFTSLPVIAVFNATSVSIMHPFWELLLKLLLMFVSLIIYTVIATLFSAVLKSKTAAVIIALLLNLVGTILGGIFYNSQIFKYFIFSNSELYMYWGNGPLYNDMTLGFSSIICLAYVAIFGAITYYVFTKKDLN